MYGKNILGSKESFEGYELDTSSCGKLCNTAKEYIDTIKYFSENPVPRYNVYSRSIFETKYSNAFALKYLKSYFDKNKVSGSLQIKCFGMSELIATFAS